MKARLRIDRVCIAFIVMISSFLLMLNFSKVDNIPYYRTVETGIVDYSDFIDSESLLDRKTENALVIHQGSGLKIFSADIMIGERGAVSVNFDVKQSSPGNSTICVDLYSSDYDSPYSEVVFVTESGENTVSEYLEHFQRNTVNECELRIFTYSEAELEITNLRIDSVELVTDGSTLVWTGVVAMALLFAFSVAYLMVTGVRLFVHRNKEFSLCNCLKKEEMQSDAAMYAVLFCIVSCALFLIYRKANLRYPLIYSGGDEMGIYYLVKTIRDYGTSLFNPMIGGITGGDMFDYPYSDLLSFVTVKFISWFTRDPYLITNLFYFLNYYLIAFAGAFVCRKLGIKHAVSVLVAVLYAFSYFIQGRYGHMWLTPYYLMPFACLVAVWIIEGKIYEEATKIKENKTFWGCILISYICAFTGLYYAYFACALFAAAIVIRLFSAKKQEIKKELYPIAFILSTIAGVITNVLPNLMFWAINGVNPASELSLRNGSDSELYALKLVQMLLPRELHRIPLLSKIAAKYTAIYPLVNENVTAALGVIASIGFVVSILIVLSQKEKGRTYAYLNLSMFLIGTIGGIGSIISVFINIPMRCYNRISVVIMFLSLLVVAVYLEDFGKRLNQKHFVILCSLLTIIGLYDQTNEYTPSHYGYFEETRAFINDIEHIMSPGDMIFQLPYDNWPTGRTYKNHVCYVESEDLHWSYGAMQGRSEALWQQYIISEGTASMIDNLKKAGYDGLYLDRDLYIMIHGEEKYKEDVAEIIKCTGHEPETSYLGTALFWDIR